MITWSKKLITQYRFTCSNEDEYASVIATYQSMEDARILRLDALSFSVYVEINGTGL